MSRPASCSKWRSNASEPPGRKRIDTWIARGLGEAVSRATSTPRLHAPAFHGGGDFQAFAVFGDRAPGDVDIGVLQPDDNCVVGQNLRRPFMVDHLTDLEPHRFARMRVAAVMCGDRGREKIFELEETARRRHIFVGGYPGDSGFMHAYRLSDRLEIERAQTFDAMR